jgi:NDP-sugar pyrophosphorylase family protein
MQAILIATSDNEKLLPLTKTKPSPLLSIGNRPVMEIVLEQLARAGFKQIIVCLNRMAGDIEAYFGDGSRWGVALEYVLLRESLGAAGALARAKSLIKDPFIVMPGDAIIGLDIQAAFEHHRLNQYTATVILHQQEHQVTKKNTLDDADHLTTNTQPIDGEQWCSETGVYIFDPEALSWIPTGQRFDIDTHLLPALSKAGQSVGVYVMDEYWNPLESSCEFQDAQTRLLFSLWRNGPFLGQAFITKYSQLVGKEVIPGVWVGRNSRIHPSAQLIPPVLLGENVNVGQGVVLGPETVVGANTIIADQASIQSSTIFENTYVGKLIHIQDRLVDRNLVIDSGSSEHIQITDPFLLYETPRSVPSNALNRALEVLAASLMLLITLPLTISIGLMVWLLFGSVFQPEPRLKMALGRPLSEKPSLVIFPLLRFRTRRSDGQSNWIGHWLEHLELNRLPELWNVLTGEMKLVGTKPLAPQDTLELTAIWQQDYDRLVPGFTGLWYVQTEPCSELDETIVANIYYAATRSWKADAQILLKTPQAWNHRVRKPDCVEFISRDG